MVLWVGSDESSDCLAEMTSGTVCGSASMAVRLFSR